jgi:hypothetical protein
MVALLNSSMAGASMRDTAERALAEQNLKEQALRMPVGTVVEVKYLEKGSRKLVGRLGPVTDTGFEVQVAGGGMLTTEQVAYSDVKSLKERKGMHPVTKGVIIGGVAFGVLVAILAISVAAAGVD